MLGLVVAVAGVTGAAGSAVAEGVQNEQQAAVCSHLLGSFLPGLVPTSSVCSVNVVGQPG
ncbi:hypothetical protein [Streptomyces sp. TLI_171]|uniref:hypothetical protein n=1 Tax=Streptomyces sp. TLI_171 TaxID=1938859 RepID=UPI000C1795EE|nr:hypothetical protein [Streptomyces sp. TLI_171]